MCRGILVLATLTVLPLGASLDGQTTRPVESELVARIDSLSTILDRADSVAKVADAVLKEEQRRLLAGRIDTIQVGPFFVVTPVRQVGLATRYFERAWASYAAMVGSERTAIEGHVFLFGKSELLRGLDSWESTRMTTRYMPSDKYRAIGRVLGVVLSADLPEDLRTWAGEFLVRADPTSELERAYRSLLTTASAAVTDCYDGALDRCWDAMGLDHQDDWAAVWYTAAERRSLVGRVSRQLNSVTRGILNSCLDAQRDDACMAVLLDQGGAASIPLPRGARMTLLAHTLSLGGPEAWRVLATGNIDAEGGPEAPLKDRLVRASGVSADSLIGSWRAATFQARPDVQSDTKKIRWSSLFWLLVLAGVSTRSTRWRLT